MSHIFKENRDGHSLMANMDLEISLSLQDKVSYVNIIDSILAVSDLEAISERRIRTGIEKAVGHDVSHHKVSQIELELDMSRSLTAFSRLLSNRSYWSAVLH